MKRLCSMRHALEDPEIFGAILPGESWAAWRVLLIASQGEVLTDDERVIFTALTGRDHEPDAMCEETWGIIGRRGGKTRAFAVGSAYFAALVDYDDVLAPGERGVLPILAASTWQAQKAFNYVAGVFDNVPRLADMVTNKTADVLSLSNGVDIEVRPANFNTIRSITAVAALADEVAFWRNEQSKNPDKEILNALRPALATTGGPLFVMSSPHARKGELWTTYKRDFGPRGDPLVLVAKAASRTMNPELKASVVARAYAKDPSAAKAEYGAEFREDLEDFVNLDVVEACITKDVHERPRIRGITYRAFVDPSGGSADAMTLAIGHNDGGIGVLDAVRVQQPPFSPDAVVQNFCEVLKSYGINRVVGDRYAGEWPRERFRVHGITYDLSDMPKSELYGALLPILNSRRANLLDIDLLKSQLSGLERRTARGGKDSIDHASGAHDDLANAVAGLMVGVAKRKVSTMDLL